MYRRCLCELRLETVPVPICTVSLSVPCLIGTAVHLRARCHAYCVPFFSCRRKHEAVCDFMRNVRSQIRPSRHDEIRDTLQSRVETSIPIASRTDLKFVVYARRPGVKYCLFEFVTGVRNGLDDFRLDGQFHFPPFYDFSAGFSRLVQ